MDRITSWKILDYLDSRAVAKLLSSDRNLTFTSMSGSDWRTSKQEVHNWPSNKSDLPPHHGKLASSWPSHAYWHKPRGPRTTLCPAVIHLRPTSDWPMMLCNRLASNLRPRRDRIELHVWLGRSLHEIKLSRVTCDWLMTDIRGYRVNYDQPTKTCGQRRIQLRVGSVASEIDKFHDRFRRLKAVAELVHFNGE